MSQENRLYRAPNFIKFLWASLILASVIAFFEKEWITIFISFLTLVSTYYFIHLANKIDFHVPSKLLTATIVFIYATLFLGEVGDFYEKFWWWDIVLHTGSAIGFGLIGVIILIFLFKFKRVQGSPKMIAFFSFSFAVSIGAIWEIFEFSMDQLFGLNMQKSGLNDTMYDLMVDCGGALLASVSSYMYLHKDIKVETTLTEIIDEAVTENNL